MTRIPPHNLTDFITRLLRGIGTTDTLAPIVADALVAADLRGHASHGVMRVPWYAKMSEHGPLDLAAEPQIEQDGAFVTVDARDAFGQAVSRLATDTLTHAAADHGIAIAGIRDAAHLGRIGDAAERAAAAGFVFVAFVNTQGGALAVAPPGTASRRLSTNPVAVGVPTFDALPYSIVLDIATSQVATGKIRDRENTDDTIPEGWTITPSGDPVVDPRAFLEDGEGASLPLGGLVSGYKGFGLGVVTELIAGIQSDGRVAGQADMPWPSNAAAYIAWDPLRATTRNTVESHVQTLVTHLRTAEPSGRIPVGPAARQEVGHVPGGPEYYLAMDRLADGIPLPRLVVDALTTLADTCDLTDSIPRHLQPD